MGNLFKPKVAAAPPPPPEQVFNYRDEVTGTEQVRQQNPDGSITLVTRALPMSAEEKAALDRIKQLEADTIKRIDDLTTNYDISKIDGLSDTINAFRSGQQRNLEGAYKSRSQEEEQVLARYGVEDSTAAAQTRSQRGRDFTDSQIQIGEQSRLLENDIRQQELGNATNLFSLAQGSNQQNFANRLGALQLGNNAMNANAQLGQQRQLAIYNANLNDQSLRTSASAAGKKALGDLIGTAIGGYMGRK